MKEGTKENVQDGKERAQDMASKVGDKARGKRLQKT